MRLLCKLWLPPIGLVLLAGLFSHKGQVHGFPVLLGGIGAFWLWLDLPFTFFYILYRIFFRAKRDAAH